MPDHSQAYLAQLGKASVPCRTCNGKPTEEEACPTCGRPRQVPEPSPGPWTFDPPTATIRTASNIWLATLNSWDGQAKPHQDANGALMAAAPDLLAALESMEELVAGEISDAGACLSQAKAAIAKALGGA